MENKKLNIILGIVSFVIVVIILIMAQLIMAHESSRVYFDINDIKDNNYITDDYEFKIQNNKVYFKVYDNVIFDNKDYEFNNQTGEIKTKDNSIYVRSVSNENIVIWYSSVEYNIKKEIIAR